MGSAGKVSGKPPAREDQREGNKCSPRRGSQNAAFSTPASVLWARAHLGFSRLSGRITHCRKSRLFQQAQCTGWAANESMVQGRQRSSTEVSGVLEGRSAEKALGEITGCTHNFESTSGWPGSFFAVLKMLDTRAWAPCTKPVPAAVDFYPS